MMTTNEDTNEPEWSDAEEWPSIDEWPNTGEQKDDGWTGHRRPITEDERPAEVVVTAVAAVTERSPLEMTPLYGVVDPDALDALCCDNSNVTTCFQYEGCQVLVDSGVVRVRKLA